MNWKIHIHFRVRNESICYIVFIDRTKPDNSVRINPATRHSETKYGFVILTGDMIFKDFFVRVKFLLEGRKQKAIKPSEFSRVIVDTTVQPKNVTFPTDAKLLNRAREKLVRLAQRPGV